MGQQQDRAEARKHRVNWRTDKILEVCAALEGELPRAKRALVAARRSGRDGQFNAYLAFKRIKLEVAKPMLAVVEALSKMPGASRG